MDDIAAIGWAGDPKGTCKSNRTPEGPNRDTQWLWGKTPSL